MAALGIDIRADWTPIHAMRLLAENEYSVAAAHVRLGTVRDMELARLDRVVAVARVNRPVSRRRLDAEAREARVAICREWERRTLLLQDVARAHGLIGGRQ